jgi:hypothetical protein
LARMGLVSTERGLTVNDRGILVTGCGSV